MSTTLELSNSQVADQELHVHVGAWPRSSWLYRMAMGVFVANFMCLPALFPELHFTIDGALRTAAATAEQPL